MSCRSSVVRSSELQLVVPSMAWLLLPSVPAFATAIDATRGGGLYGTSCDLK